MASSALPSQPFNQTSTHYRDRQPCLELLPCQQLELSCSASFLKSMKIMNSEAASDGGPSSIFRNKAQEISVIRRLEDP